jgi:2-C-methyl-D-erythritol 2,4-cyclodiphosphate synthase
MRIGIGYDSHRMVEGARLILGGVEIPFYKGLIGHSDADVLCHAITDAIIGALGKGDIGMHFPDTDPQWKGASSIYMLKLIVDMAKAEGFRVSWVDSVVITERPKLSPYMDAMKEAIAQSGILAEVINIKAKTNEKMGFTGREEGIAVHAACLLEPIRE